ncbi:MAG: autotransporter-associated beta strand repeat-containing protein [Bacteroidaceae bacterium]|nr:autotransporter-associated beta strand repeat-containing protein [Bacteroidaceae bacterium]
MKKLFLALAILASFCLTANAQRKTDALDRGLVVGQTYNSLYLSWRRLSDEYYDVTYNVYRKGVKIAENLTKTNYTDSNNTSSNYYQIAAVVNGVEQPLSSSVSKWTESYYLGSAKYVPYLDLNLTNVYDRDGSDVTDVYQPNDAEFADLDGDGQLEMIVKRLNTTDANNLYPQDSKAFVVIDAYDINWQTGATTLMWRIDCGPNMISLNSTEINVIAFDWDEDGKAEVVMRGADNMRLWNSSLTSYTTIGDANVNTRAASYTSSQYAWTNSGSEYLIYLSGDGILKQCVTYPLARSDSRDFTSYWGYDTKGNPESYGHRMTKHFYAAPSFDGRTHSLFLARGIYARTKMIALDLNSSSVWNISSPRWYWETQDVGTSKSNHSYKIYHTMNSSDSGTSSDGSWFGQGNHNFTVADVDCDGRDEIVYGSMCIDDNGYGLSTTGLGHGDAMHVGDLNPYVHGLEVFACNEDSPNMNYRNATTSEIYYRSVGESDDGRCLMDNFTDDYPGSIGRSVNSALISSVGDYNTITDVTTSGTNDPLYWSHLNNRIYWDSDLCSEILDSPGTASYAAVWKVGTGRLWTANCGGSMINDSKNNPCFQGDLIGDWREEIVTRTGSNSMRLFTTGYSTEYTMPCLWFDYQYRQAMSNQMMVYNQPPHVSYFVGALENFTVAPPAYTDRNRTEISNSGTINSSYDGKQVLLAATGNMSVSVNSGAAPYMLIDNAPTWVTTGTSDGGTLTTYTYTHTLTGGALTGGMHLVKQGDGTLKMATNTHTYTGKTDIWAGTVEFDGTLQNSPVWMNRFTTLSSNGGTFGAGIESLYASTIKPGGADNRGDITTTTLTLNYGARLQMDVYGSNISADHVNMESLVLNSVSGDNWETYGPQYLKPVLEFVPHGTLADGMYLLGSLTNEADFSNLTVEGLSNYTYELVHKNGNWYLKIGTGEAVECPAPEIARTSWNETGLNVYYPTVSISGTPFTYKGNTVSPNLSAVFTALDGTETVIENTLFYEDFEGSTTASDYWVNNNSSYIYSPSYDNSEGQCIGMQSSSDRGDWTKITADYDGVMNYNIEFDAYFNNASKQTNFVVMSKSHAASWTYNYGYNWLNATTFGHNPYLFYMMRGENSTTFTINEVEGNTVTLNNSTWYHFVLSVDVEAGTVGYQICPKGTATAVASGSYTLLDGESAECDGIYIRNGRYNYEPGGAGIDNIYIYKSSVTTELFAQNYENETGVTGWVTSGANMSLATGDETYGSYFYVNTGSTNTRYAYNELNLDVSEMDTYNIDFDLAVTSGNTDGVEFCVMSQGGKNPTTTWDNYASINSYQNLLFDISAGKSSTNYTINGTSTTTTLSGGTWYHYTLNVNKTTKTVKWSISNGDSGTFTYTGSGDIRGFYLVAGRYYSIFKLDNISITTTKEATDLSTYTFTEPGTLTVTASYDGCMSSSTSYTSEIGAKVGTLGYSTLNYQLASLDFSKSGLELYKVAVDSDKKNVTTTLVSDGILPQGTAGLIKGTAGEIFASEIVSDASDWTGNDLIPTTETVYGNGNIFVLNTGASGVGFYKLNDTGTVTVGRGYLEINGLTTKALSMFDDDTPTGIIGVNDDEADKPTVIYDLSGRRVTKPGKGIYIVNGKKVVIK